MFIGDWEEKITFEKLYDKYEKYLYFIALSIARDQYLAEDRSTILLYSYYEKHR